VKGPASKLPLGAFFAAHADPPALPDKDKLFRGLADLLHLTMLQLMADRPGSARESVRETNESVIGAAAHLACLEAWVLI
jgi:hypothetical protein